MSNTKEQISRNMRSNKFKDTKPEIMVRKICGNEPLDILLCLYIAEYAMTMI